MELLTQNPGFLHLGQEIFLYLDHKSLLECQEVCRSWKRFLDNPKFWIKKCKQKGLTQDLYYTWMKLSHKLEETETCLEQNVTKCLIRMHLSLIHI